MPTLIKSSWIRQACTVAILSATALTANAQNSQDSARQQWHQLIGMGYGALASESDRLRSVASRYCGDPSGANRAATDQAWQTSFSAWQQVRFVDFGPIEKDNLAWQFQFWPDPKNLIATKARFLLASEQPITPKLIDDSGVAVQGFPMVEYLLFDARFDSSERSLPAPKTCELLKAVTAHMADNAKRLSENWQAFKAPYLATDQYRTATIRSAMSALEILEERRLAQPMGLRGNGKRSVYAADAWRSGNSLATNESTLVGLQTQFLPGLIHLLDQNGQAELAERIQKQFQDVLEHFPQLNQPMAPLLAEDSQFAQLQGFYVDVSQLVTLVNDQAAVKLGVVRGFNSSDGD